MKTYFKFGIYRSKVSIYKQIHKKDIPIQVVYFDEVRAGKKEDVIKFKMKTFGDRGSWFFVLR